MRSSLAKSVVEWFRAVAARTGAFRVANVEHASKTDHGPTPTGYDLAIELIPAAGGRPIPLAVEAQERVSPLLAIGILQRIADSPTEGVPTLCSRVISERVAELCRAQGVSYLDEAGNCRLCAPGLFLQVEGRKPPRSVTHPQVDPFALKSSRIGRVLLGGPRRGWQVQELADEAQVSLGLVAKIKRALLEQAFVEERARRLYMRDPKGLLEAWAGRYKPSEHRVSLYLMEQTSEAERKVAQWCAAQAVRFALTDLAGAWRLAPTVRWHQSTIYVEGEERTDVVSSLVQHLGAKRVESGSNLVLVVPEDPFVFYQSRKTDAVNVVSPVQLYLDLRKQPGRGGEAAEEILKQEIVPTW